ncbi:hypothetical protein [Saccharothrix deserti]|uniref:hypothetical protein n=1 Tax=Saccharothrix deserti TaxID=2593674 RepID=UPI00131CBD82|nr:hypothetical protein [Saccharothrix deserti]
MTGRSPGEIAVAIERALLTHPAVVRLDGGAFGVIATPAPGRRVVGVDVAGEGRRVEIAVVVRIGRPVPEVVAELRDRVTRIAGPVKVDVTVSDVE